MGDVKIAGLIRNVTSSYDAFDFHEAFRSLYQFCIMDMSSFYLDILKDRIYTFRPDSPERRAASGAHRILLDMTRLMAPVLSFTSEEIWSYPRKVRGRVTAQVREESVFLSGFPVADNKFNDPELEKRWDMLTAIRNEANKALLEIKRKDKFIGNALEAKLLFTHPVTFTSSCRITGVSSHALYCF